MIIEEIAKPPQILYIILLETIEKQGFKMYFPHLFQ
jgi:hypothetical protein